MLRMRFSIVLHRIDGTSETFDAPQWPGHSDIPEWAVRAEITRLPEQFHLKFQRGNGIDADSWLIFDRDQFGESRRLIELYDEESATKLLALLNS